MSRTQVAGDVKLYVSLLIAVQVDTLDDGVKTALLT
jgi:hypothetical protein